MCAERKQISHKLRLQVFFIPFGGIRVASQFRIGECDISRVKRMENFTDSIKNIRIIIRIDLRNEHPNDSFVYIRQSKSHPWYIRKFPEFYPSCMTMTMTGEGRIFGAGKGTKASDIMHRLNILAADK